MISNAKGKGYCQKFFEYKGNKDMIIRWYKGGTSCREINRRLLNVFGVMISGRSVGCFLKMWGVEIRGRGGANNVKIRRG